jgi:hypothetical protein
MTQKDYKLAIEMINCNDMEYISGWEILMYEFRYLMECIRYAIPDIQGRANNETDTNFYVGEISMNIDQFRQVSKFKDTSNGVVSKYVHWDEV